MLLAYSGWTGTVEDKPYNSPRVWATLSPVDAMEEGQPVGVLLARPAATIVRNLLFLPAASNSKASRWLLDAAGRKVMELRPGANDLHALAPGVYFAHEAFRDGPAANTKVVTVR